MHIQEIIKWFLYVIAVIVFIILFVHAPDISETLAFFLVLNAIFWQHEVGGTGGVK